MTLELVDESDLKPIKETPRKIENVDIKLKLVSKGDIKFCERIKNGALSNCAICENLNKEFFRRCSNKWGYNE